MSQEPGNERKLVLKSGLAGAFALAAMLALLAGTVPVRVPTSAAFGMLARATDSLSPWFLALAFVFSVPLIALGWRRLGAVLILAAIAVSAQFYVEQRKISVAPATDAPADIRILFFNAFASNSVSAERIVSSAIALDPDIIVFVESAAVRPALDKLSAAYNFVSPCEEEDCEVLLASRIRPKRFWRLTLSAVWQNRYAVAEFEIADGRTFFLAGSQLAKPWLAGIAESELSRLEAQYNWFQGNVVAVGDFNMAPWSRPMRQLLQRTGLRALPRPLATWPVRAGGFGLPIDLILVRGGARVVQVRPFGDDLGSNHRGVVADVAIPRSP